MSMIVLVTDFGTSGPYIGQLKAVLASEASGVPVIDLFSDLPAYDIKPAAYLLAAYSQTFPDDTVFLCVVDPGVGSNSRLPVVLRANNHWFVGPDNGLFNCLVKDYSEAQCWQIDWVPEKLSATFHGRDLFAPVAASLARGEKPAGPVLENSRCLKNDWPVNYPAVVYIDYFGNVLTGIHAKSISDDDRINIAGEQLEYSRTFSDVSPGQLFWYRNANGLIEVAANQASAAVRLGVQVGDEVLICEAKV